jgi:hypothetical protein
LKTNRNRVLYSILVLAVLYFLMKRKHGWCAFLRTAISTVVIPFYVPEG